MPYPLLVWEALTSRGYLLQHLTTHLAYHLGQLNYHRHFSTSGRLSTSLYLNKMK